MDLSLIVPSSSVYHGRFVLIGDASVGKTSILNRMSGKPFSINESSTIGANYQLLTNDIDDMHVEVQLWDTAGQEKFRSLIPVYFRNAIGSLVVFDLTNRVSFENLDSWISTFKEFAGEETSIIIVGNKCDLQDKIEVSNEEATQWSESCGYLYFCVSANTGEGIPALFDSISRELIKTKVTTSSKSFTITETSQNSCC